MLAARRTRVLTTTAAAALLLLLTACSGGGNDDGGGSAGSDVAMSAPEAGPSGAAGVADTSAGGGRSAAQPAVDVEQQAVISTGTVQLKDKDVGQALFDVRKVVDSYAGTIAEDDTETDDDGAALRSRMVLRIPTSDFAAAMADLEKVGTLVASKRSSEDVTTQVLDAGVRVDAAKRAIERIQTLYAQASDIKDVMAIESELSQRQADLASLEAQQRYLADQTSLSTITVSVERTTAAHSTTKPDHRDAGFLAGLSGGWGALVTFLVGAATVLGALLPWLVVALVLGVPTWVVVRRLRRRTPAAT